MVPDKRIQGRAISLKDGGRADGDAPRAQIAGCSRFVLSFRAFRRVAIAGFLATSLLAGLTVDGWVKFSYHSAEGRRLVSPSSDGCAHSVADGADNVSGAASHDATGSGPPFHFSPGELNPGTRGTQV